MLEEIEKKALLNYYVTAGQGPCFASRKSNNWYLLASWITQERGLIDYIIVTFYMYY
jgi:hypothetical protein